jgi:1,4-alpha-glucan branching enzyme
VDGAVHSDWDGYSDDFGNHSSMDTMAGPGERDGLQYHGCLGLGRYSAVILSRDR